MSSQPAVTVSDGEIETPIGHAPVFAVVLAGIGAWFLWFGVKYWRGAGPAAWPSFPVKSVLQGHGLPANQPAPSPTGQVTSYEQTIGAGVGAGLGVTGSAIANDALRYQGAPYKWGGANPQGWDCSGFVNWVVGHDLGQPIPGVAGGFDGQSHGPDVAQWIAWPQATHVPVAEAGDLVCWGPNAHMGIALGGGQMISALNPSLGTRETSIVSAHAGVPVIKRIAASGTGGGGGGAQNTARLLLAKYGWKPDQMTSLIPLWTHESNWSPVARNPVSGALGIPQAYGHGGSDTGGTLGNEFGAEYGLTVDQARAANSGKPVPQIRWGLGYIKAVYGSPAKAWQFWQAHGWY